VDLMDQQELQDYQVRLVLQALLVYQDQAEHLGRRVLLVSREPRDRWDQLADLDQPVPADRLDPQDRLDRLEVLEAREVQVQAVLLDHLVHQELLGHLFHRAHLACLVRLVQREHQAHLVHLELQVQPGQRVQLVSLVLQGQLGLLAARGLLDLQASQVALVVLDHKDLLVILVQRVHLAVPDPQVQRERLV